MKGSVIKRVGWWKDKLSLICLDEHKTLEGGGCIFENSIEKLVPETRYYKFGILHEGITR